MRNILRVLAVVLAVSLALGETVRSWGVARPWYAVADDFFMAALLGVAAARSARREGPAFLAGAYGFASGLLYGSFFLHIQALSRLEADPGNIQQSWLTALIGAGFGLALLGFGLSLREAVIAGR